MQETSTTRSHKKGKQKKGKQKKKEGKQKGKKKDLYTSYSNSESLYC